MRQQPLARRYLRSLGALAVGLCCMGAAACASSASTSISTTPGNSATATAIASASTTADTGTPSPSTTASSDDPTSTPGVTLDQFTVFTGTNGVYYGLNAATGQKRWNTAIDGSPNKPTAVNGVIYVTTDTGWVYAINGGSILWKKQRSSAIESRPAVVNSVVYGVSDDGVVFALDAGNGNEKWHYNIGSQVSNISVAVQSDGSLFVGASDTYLYALNPNGSLRCRKQLGTLIEFTSPTLGSGVVYTGADNGQMYAINTSNCSFKWQNPYQASGQILGKPALDNGVLYFGCADQNLYAVDANTGTLKWKKNLSDGVTSSPTVSGGIVYATAGGYLFALHTGDGSQAWKFHANNGFTDQGWPTVSNGLVFIGTGDGNIYALNASNGSKKWSFNGGGSMSQPTIGL